MYICVKYSRIMLIRFTVKNLFSFKEETEFNLLPGRVKRLNHHKYERKGVEILKLSALYGANGSGKSNLIKAISVLKVIAVQGIIPNLISSSKFKLAESNLKEPVELSIEFFANSLIYYYFIAINNGIVIEEYFSSNGKNQEDEMIFHRKLENGKTTITFFKEFEEVTENKTLKKIIETDLLKPHQPVFFLLNSISNTSFVDIKVAHDWFANGLVVIYPETKASSIVLALEKEKRFKDFATDLMCSFNTGITNLKIETKTIEEFFGNDNQKEMEDIKAGLNNNTIEQAAIVTINNIEDIIVVKENEKYLTKRLLFEHKGEKNKDVEFRFDEESDGTRRLLEYLPALNNVIHNPPTYIIDEIERSIHPLIIKELIEKFSKDETTKGQLIFTTHESNLLDQEVFRTDEIWFTEKNMLGATKLYSLSDFKEHNMVLFPSLVIYKT